MHLDADTPGKSRIFHDDVFIGNDEGPADFRSRERLGDQLRGPVVGVGAGRIAGPEYDSAGAVDNVEKVELLVVQELAEQGLQSGGVGGLNAAAA